MEKKYIERQKDKYNIGAVSKITGLSIKTLRYYDSKGVLVPSNRGESNHYRYYTEDQIIKALAIREMRLRGLGIDEIRNILCAESLQMINDVLNIKMKEIKIEIEQLEKQMLLVENSRNLILQALPAIQQSVDEINYRQYSVTIFPKRTCLFTRYISRIWVNEIFWDRFAEIYKLLDERKYMMSGPVIAVFHEHYTHQFFFEEGDLEILLPVHEADLSDECVKEFGDFMIASKVFVGFYNKLLPEYIDLIKWIEKNNYEIVGNAMEEYIVEFTHGVSKEEYVTKISFPVKIKSRKKTKDPSSALS